MGTQGFVIRDRIEVCIMDERVEGSVVFRVKPEGEIGGLFGVGGFAICPS